MAKPSKEALKKRGENVKLLLKQYGWTQANLADAMNIGESNINAKLNGKRTLTEEDAEQIAELFPPVRVGWILGNEKYPTRGAENTAVLANASDEASHMESGLILFATLLGYSITVPDILEGQVEDVLEQVKHGYLIEKDGQSIHLSLEEMNRFENKICDLIGLELKYLFEERSK